MYQNKDLFHYGTKRHSGRYPWGSGERPFQGLTKGDIVLKKGQKFSRLSLSKNENVRNVRKYVSVGKDTEKEWEDLFQVGYAKQGYQYLYKNRYKALKDMKVSSTGTNEKMFWDWINSEPDIMIQVMRSAEEWSKDFGIPQTFDLSKDFFRQIGINKELNNRYYKYMKDAGYDAIADVYGISSGADKSIIVLDPDKDLKMIKQKEINIQKHKRS